VGETIMEVLLAIVLMGIGFTAILSGMFTSAKVAQVNQRNTEAALALQALAEAILQPVTAGGSTYIPCAGYDGDADDARGDQYREAMTNRPPAVSTLLNKGWTWRVSNIRYFRRFYATAAEPDIQATWAVKARPDGSTDTYSQLSCLGNRDWGMQEITIEIANPTTLPGPEQVVRTIVVVKRDRTCPPTSPYYSNADAGPC
jgi:type II secretory pathway pseudopilin PulG